MAVFVENLFSPAEDRSLKVARTTSSYEWGAIDKC